MSKIFNSYMDNHLEEENNNKNININFDLKNDELIFNNDIDKQKFIFSRDFNSIHKGNSNINYFPKKEMKYN